MKKWAYICGSLTVLSLLTAITTTTILAHKIDLARDSHNAKIWEISKELYLTRNELFELEKKLFPPKKITSDDLIKNKV